MDRLWVKSERLSEEAVFKLKLPTMKFANVDAKILHIPYPILKSGTIVPLFFQVLFFS